MTHINQFDIMCITESWLNDNFTDNNIAIENYCVERRDRVDQTGGGVLIYIRKTLYYQRLVELENLDLEVLWVKLRFVQMPRSVPFILIGLVYHPQTASNYELLNYLTCCIDKVTIKHPDVGVMLLGDFNLFKELPR